MQSEARSEIIKRIKKERLVAIIRLAKEEQVADTLDCLVEGGVEVLEVTSNTPGFERQIKQARKRHPQTLIGAGTIINAGLASRAISAGAQFSGYP